MRTLYVLALISAYVVLIAGASETCASDCTGHGQRTPAGSCVCDDGFYGADCQFSHSTKLPGHCQSTGDPHFITFGSAKYSYQGHGIYWLVHSEDNFHIQEWHVPYGNKSPVSVNKAVYIRYGDTMIEAAPTFSNNSLSISVDGQMYNFKVGDKKAKSVTRGNVRIIPKMKAKRNFGVTLELVNSFDGEWRTAQVVLRPGRNTGRGMSFLNILVSVDNTWLGKLNGLCDRFQQAANGDYSVTTLLPRNGATALAVNKNNVLTFGQSWRADCSEVGFTDFAAADCANAPQPIPEAPSCAVVTAKAEDVCALACAYRQQCLDDVMATCELAAADTQIAAFEHLRDTQGWDQCGGDWCNPCNGHGTCSNGHCTCDSGYTGNQCQTRTSVLPCSPSCVDGQGYCNDNGQCVCYTGWKGADCGQQAANAACPANCNGRGSCAYGVCACNPTYYGTACEHQVRSSVQKATCTVVGDPHYTTFDGLYYSYQGHGAFYIVYTPELIIQGWHKAWVCNTNNYVQTAVALKQGNSVLELYAGDKTTGARIAVDNTMQTFEGMFHIKGTTFMAGPMKVQRLSSSSIKVTLADGQSTVTMSVGLTGSNQLYINLGITLYNRYYGQTRGLCGTWTSDHTDDWIVRGANTPVTPVGNNNLLYATFGPSWHVPCSESLFTNMPASICNMLPSPVPAPGPGKCTAVENIAEQVCLAACTTYSQCVHDVYAACDIAAANPHVNMYQAIQDVWEGPLCTYTPPVCQNSCSGHGTCVADSTCQCEEGFSGPDCSIEACPASCSGKGECVDGACCCDTWWTGADCATPTCTDSCNGHGTCSAPDTCACHADETNGFWTGEYCNSCQEGYSGASCTFKNCPSDCSGKGTCDGTTGTCTCVDNWSGEACNVFAPDMSKLAPKVECRLPGPDLVPGATAAIVFGFENVNTITYTIPVGASNSFSPVAADQSQPTTFAPGATAAYPAGGVVVPFGSATAVTWTLGTASATGDMDTPLCVLPCPSDCNNRGQCISGNCVCEAGYSGVDCGALISSVYPVGLCIIRHANYTSTALFSYINRNSQSLLVPVGVSNSFESVADMGQFVEFDNIGLATEMFHVAFETNNTLTYTLGDRTIVVNDSTPGCNVPCPNDCNGNGFCDAGMCVCDEHYTGSDCSVAHALARDIVPVLKCVKHDCATCGYSAVFGYVNSNPVTSAMPVGDMNSFSPLPADRGQPTSFELGSHLGLFEVDLDPTVGVVAWKLGETVVTATMSSQRCPLPCPNSCSGHGTCNPSNGVCTCGVGFAGTDCSTDNRLSLVIPYLSCVGQVSENEWLARFFYVSHNTDPLVVPYGTNNKLIPDQEPPVTVFNPGQVQGQPYINDVPFAAGQTVIWQLGSYSASASMNDIQCAPDTPLIPQLHCVSASPVNGQLTAYFGWNNPNEFAVTLAAGDSQNYVNVPEGSQVFGQISRFMPGPSAAYPNSPIVVMFPAASTILWNLGTFVVSASGNSPVCSSNLVATSPTWLTATMSNDLISIALLAEVPMAGAAAGTSVACSGMLSSAVMETLGASPTCTWSSNRVLTINLGPAATIVPGDIVVAAGASALQTWDVELTAPTSPIAPHAVVLSPNSLLVCEPLYLDGTGSLGGGMQTLTYTWSIVSAPTSSALTSVQNALASSQHDMIVSFSQLDPGVYIFKLTVKDFLGATNAATATVTMLSGQSSITVNIAGPNAITVHKGDSPITLQANAAFPCAAPNANAVAYQWIVTSGSVLTLPDVTVTSSSLVLPVTLLTAGSTYNVAVKAANAADSSVSATASVTVTVLSGPVIATISGSASLLTSAPLTVSAAGSYDVNTGTASGLNYAWACRALPSLQPCTSLSGVVLTFPNAQSVTVPAATLAAGSYEFTVVVSAADGRAAAASTTMTLANSGITVAVAPLASNIFTDDQLELHAAVTPSFPTVAYTVQWTLTSGTLAKNSADCYQTSLNANVLVIAPFCLTPGASYRFDVTASEQGSSASAFVSFTVQSGPTGGRLTVAPPSGTTSSPFNVQAVSWTSARTPLSYQFFYQMSGNPTVFALSLTQSDNRFSTYLPAGSLTLIAEVTDASTATTTAQVDVTVTAQITQGGDNKINSIMTTDIPSCLRTQNYDTCTSLIARCVFYLNSGGFPSASDQQAKRMQLLASLSVVQNGLQQQSSSTAVVLSLINAITSDPRYVNSDTATAATTLVATTTSTPTVQRASASTRQGALVAGAAGNVAASGASSVLTAQSSRTAVEAAVAALETRLQPGQAPAQITSPQLTATVTVLPTNARLGASGLSSFGPFTLPVTMAAMVNIPSGARVAVRVEQWTINPHSYAPSAASVASGMVSMVIDVNGQALPVSGLSSNIVVQVPRTSHAFVGSPVCAYFNEASGDWSTGGCTYSAADSTATTIACACNHLTDFAVLDSALMPRLLPTYAWVLLAIGAAVVLAVGGGAVAYRVHKSRAAAAAVSAPDQVELTLPLTSPGSASSSPTASPVKPTAPVISTEEM